MNHTKNLKKIFNKIFQFLILNIFFISIFVISLIYLLFRRYYRLEKVIGKIKIDSLFYRNYNNSQFYLSPTPKSFSKCQLCNFKPYGKSIPNSSERDAILTIGTNKLLNLVLFIKTLRTTGSKCRFILFANNKVFSNYKSDFFRTIDDCGVEIINIGDTSPDFRASHIRFMIFKEFLIKNRNLIDRVFLCDLYDTVVQHDPFITEFGNSLYLNDEGFLIKQSPINSGWIYAGFKEWKIENEPILKFDETLKKNIYNQKILNSGVQAGTTDIMIKFCSIMCSSINKKTFQPFFPHDQAFQNMVVYSGYLDKRINYKILKTNTEFFASIDLISRIIDNSTEKLVFGDIKVDGGNPGILHQYDRSKKIRELLLEVCPNLNNFTDYIRVKYGGKLKKI